MHVRHTRTISEDIVDATIVTANLADNAVTPAKTDHDHEYGSGTVNGAAGAYFAFSAAFTSTPHVVAVGKDALGAIRIPRILTGSFQAITAGTISIRWFAYGSR